MGLCAGNKLRSTGIQGEEGTYGYMYWCPGCKYAHHVTVKASPNRVGPVWGFNGDEEKPTFTPSILLRSERWVPPVTPENYAEWEKSPWQQTKVPHVCHVFVTDGKINFLSDCTHELAGKTVELPDFPSSY